MYGLTLILHYKIYTGTAVLNVYSGDGTVLLAHGGVEMGQGLNTKMMQIAAFKLNIPMDFIRVAFNSTEQVSFWGAFCCWFCKMACFCFCNNLTDCKSVHHRLPMLWVLVHQLVQIWMEEQWVMPAPDYVKGLRSSLTTNWLKQRKMDTL